MKSRVNLCLLALAGMGSTAVPQAIAQTYTVGGAVYTDLDNPITSGLEGVTVTVQGDGGVFEGTTAGQSGVWSVSEVPEGTYAVMPTLENWCFRHVQGGVLGIAPPIYIVVDWDHRAENLSIQFLASESPEIVHRTAAAGETSPCTGYIDPRIESDNGVDVNLGVREVTIVFCEPVYRVGAPGIAPDASSFTVTETGGGDPPEIISVNTTDNVEFTIQLDRPITLQEWTTIQAFVMNACDNAILNEGDLGPGVAEPDRVDIGFLPADVNQDGQVTPQDLINLRQFLTDAAYHNDCDDLLYFDIDRDGVMPEPQDLIRFRQMIAGTPPATRPWALETMNSPQP